MSGMERRKRSGYLGPKKSEERTERAVRWCKHVGGIRTEFGDKEYQFLYDGKEIRCWTTSELNPGWIYTGSKARSCLHHQIRMQRDFEWVSPRSLHTATDGNGGDS